jgi:hypothetical protein
VAQGGGAGYKDEKRAEVLAAPALHPAAAPTLSDNQIHFFPHRIRRASGLFPEDA